MQWSPRTGLTHGQGEPRRRHGVPGVILTGRATSVPFTEVLAGPERTTTDNITVAVACAAHPITR
jgi:hypothetical protein